MTAPTVVTEYADYTLTQLVDLLWKCTQRLKAAEAKLAPLKESIDALETAVQHRLVTERAEAFSTKAATAALKRTEFAELTDDRAFFAYVGKQKAWDLVRKQPVVSACRERWQDGVAIPGVQAAVRIGLSLTARKK